MSRTGPRFLLFVSSFVILSASLWLCCRKSEAVAEDPLDGEAEQLFLQYLRIDTSNPPGNETRAAKFLQGVLQREGIESQLYGDDPARQSIYARLKSGTDAPALVLLHHLDVVPADVSQWSVAPFEAARSEGYIWGRGSLDIKSLGIAELIAIVELKRTGARLSRDVIFLGVADEEAGSHHGMQYLWREHPELFDNVGFVLNEGGSNETIVDHVSYWGIEFDEKIPLWLRLTVRGRPVHSAVPPEDGGAAVKLIGVLDKVQAIPRPYRLTDSVRRYFQSAAQAKKGVKQQIYSDPGKYLDSPEMLAVLGSGARSLLKDTLAITSLQSTGELNVTPASASATADIRLLPDQSPDEMLAKIREIAGDRAEVAVLLKGIAAPPSPLNTQLYSVLAKAMRDAEADSVVGPVVSPGTSDSRFFRQRGIVAYGISPFKVNYYDANTVHGIDERIRAAFFTEGVRLTRRIVRDFCVAPGR